MPAYAEGDVADGPNGQTAVFSGGKWVVQGSPQMPLPQGDDTAMKELQAQANDAAWLAHKAQQFKALQGSRGTAVGPLGGAINTPVTTGPQYREMGIPHIAENLNPSPAIGEFLDPRVAQLESISNQAWAHMRPAGSGSLKAPEIAGFQQAFPSIDHYGRVNNGIVDRLQSDATNAATQLKFVDNFIRSGRGTYADANAAWVQQQQRPGPAMPPPPMQMVPNPQSPIGVSPAPGVAPPPASQLTPQQVQILNWTPEKGLHP